MCASFSIYHPNTNPTKPTFTHTSYQPISESFLILDFADSKKALNHFQLSIIVIIMPEEMKDVKNVKGLAPKSIRYAKKIDDDFAAGLAGFYGAVWADREGGLSKKQKHLLVFAIACSNNKTNSAIKILHKLKKFDATAEEIKDTMMIAAWTGGIQNFTDFTPAILEEMEKLGF